MTPSDPPPADPTSRVTVAAFDFDETLTRADSVVPFLRRLTGTRSLAVRSMARAHRIGPALARRDRDRLRGVATDLGFAGRTIADVDRLAAVYADQLCRVGLRDDTVARLRWHIDVGHRVVIVSASYEAYLVPVGRRLGVDAVLGTRLEVEAGTCTGRLEGPNCRGPEKAVRLRAWFDQQRLDREHLTLWAYGDSNGDRELLAMADHPVWVKGPLASVAPTS